MKRRKIAWEDRELKRQLSQCRDFGGFVDRKQIGEILGVSKMRVSQLVTRGEFREDRLGFSLSDVINYRNKRDSGNCPQKSNVRRRKGQTRVKTVRGVKSR